MIELLSCRSLLYQYLWWSTNSTTLSKGKEGNKNILRREQRGKLNGQHQPVDAVDAVVEDSKEALDKPPESELLDSDVDDKSEGRPLVVDVVVVDDNGRINTEFE